MAKRTQEDSPENPSYPRQHCIEMGGCRILINSEEGKQSVQFFHPSGSAMQFFPDGKVHMYTAGEMNMHSQHGVTQTFNGNHDVHVKGHQKTQVTGGTWVEVAGDMHVVAGGTTTVNFLGDVAIAAKGNIEIAAGGNFNINAKGDFKVDATGKTTLISDGNMTLGTKGSMARHADGAVTDKGSTIALNDPGTPSGSTTVSSNRDSGTGIV